jgi:DNA-binding NarL/FixJ family response regulator
MKSDSASATNAISVLIADDHPVVREGLFGQRDSSSTNQGIGSQSRGRGIFASSGDASKLAESMAHPELSERERQVLQHIANGRSNKEIGLAH